MATLIEVAGGLIDAIRINRLARIQRDGACYWVKERRLLSRGVATCANGFFRVVGNPVVVLSEPGQWQAWETACFNRLHESEGFLAFAEGPKEVWASHLPGTALNQHAAEGTLSREMLHAAAEELRRAHQMALPGLNGLWSHGDPHLGNFIYDPATRRARLIDFEVHHRPELSEAQRQCDDLLVILQDLMGRADFNVWQQRVGWFLKAYHVTPAQFAMLHERLHPPHGIRRLWWAIRTGYLDQRERDRRIQALQAKCQSEAQHASNGHSA